MMKRIYIILVELYRIYRPVLLRVYSCLRHEYFFMIIRRVLVMKRTILDEQGINRSLTRMSHEILEKYKGSENIVLLGIKRRGEYLGNRMREKIESIEGHPVDGGTIDIRNFRDDTKRSENTDGLDTSINLNDKHVVLVDDVLQTGRTIRAAIDAVMFHHRPKTISLAVLVDRGHRELPIRPDFVGKNIPTSSEEDVVVQIEEVDGENSVSIS